MKNLIVTFILIFTLCGNVRAQFNIPIRVDENVELMGILAHLAGYGEYCQYRAGEYDKDIDNYFKEHFTHSAVLFMKDLSMRYRIGYDAVASMGVHLKKGSDGQFSLAETEEASLEGRWNDVDKAKFLTLVSQFYKDTRFHQFFTAHEPFYQREIQSEKEWKSKHFNKGRWTKFLGIGSEDKFSIILSFCGGANSYGTRRHLKGKKVEVFLVEGYNRGE